MDPISDVAPTGSARRSGRGGFAALTVACLGLVVCVVGSFLPWLQSGATVRNSYQLGAIAGRLGLLGDGFLSGLTSVWPFIGPACLLPLVAAGLRSPRSAAAGCVILGAALTALTFTLVTRADRDLRAVSALGVALREVGPVSVETGGSLAALAGLAALLLFRPLRTRAGGSGPPPGHQHGPDRLQVSAGRRE